MRKSKMKDLWFYLLAVLMAVGCSPKSDPEVPVEEVRLSEHKLTLVIGETASLRASVSPQNADTQDLLWKSEDAAIASVAEGEVKALAEGETFVKAEVGGKSTVCLVRVVKKHIAITGLSLPETMDMKVGDVRVADITIAPADASESIVWTSEDENIVSVQGGELTAYKVGTTRITATAGKFTTSTTVRVKPQDVVIEGFTIVEKKKTLSVGEVSFVETEIKADRPKDVEIAWTSNNKDVVTVEHGRITGHKVGKAVITATAGKFTETCEVEVVEKHVAVESISITPAAIELTLGQGLLVKATTEPMNLFEPITWKSDDEKIAKVNQYGFVSSVAPGETMIHATIAGKTADCKVRVMEKGSTDVFELKVTDITATEGKLSVKVKNPDMTYYVYVLPKHKYEKTLAEFGTDDISEYDFAFWKDQGKARWLEALRMDLIKGNHEVNLDDLVRFPMWDTEYVAYCYGLDENGVKTTETLTYSFRTQPRVPNNNLTFKVTIDELDLDAKEFAATIVPSDNEATYYISLQQQNFFDFYFNESEAGNKEGHEGWDPVDHMLWKLFLGDIGVDAFKLHKGTLKIDRKFFVPKPYKFKKYQLMVVGLDRKNGRTTDITRVLVNP